MNPSAACDWMKVMTRTKTDCELQQRSFSLMCLFSFQGIFISRVNKGGAAEKAGIHVGDRLLEVGREAFSLDCLCSLHLISNFTDTAREVMLTELEVTQMCCTLLLPPCRCSSCGQWRASSDQQTALGWGLPH